MKNNGAEPIFFCATPESPANASVTAHNNNPSNRIYLDIESEF